MGDGKELLEQKSKCAAANISVSTDLFRTPAEFSRTPSCLPSSINLLRNLNDKRQHRRA